MEIHQLRYVVAVARTGSFSRAADDCHVSQPSLSQQVGKLEEELGERLFDRDRRQTRLTAAGERFVVRAARILEDLAEARREAEETKALLRGTVTIGVLPTIAPYLLPPLVEEFLRRHPSLQVAIHEDTTTALEGLMLRHEIDFAIASLPLRDDRLEITPLFTEELLLALPARHPLASRRSLRLGDLEAAPFVLMKEGHCLGDQALQFCQQKGLRPRIVSRSAQIETIRRLVGAGLGLSLVPRMAVTAPGDEAVAFRSLAGTPPSRDIIAFRHRGRPLTRVARAFFDLLQEKSPRHAI